MHLEDVDEMLVLQEKKCRTVDQMFPNDRRITVLVQNMFEKRANLIDLNEYFKCCIVLCARFDPMKIEVLQQFSRTGASVCNHNGATEERTRTLR